MVSLANNHMMDAERAGLFDTMEVLDQANIKHMGAGRNIEQARMPVIFERKGVKIAVLAYTQYLNGGVTGFAAENRAGVAPLDPELIKADIKAAKDQVDHVLLSFHWDIFEPDFTRQQELHPYAVVFAHEMIDAGADGILGHHPHVPAQ